MKARVHKLHLKTKPLFRFDQSARQELFFSNPTITMTGTQSTITTFMVKR